MQQEKIFAKIERSSHLLVRYMYNWVSGLKEPSFLQKKKQFTKLLLSEPYTTQYILFFFLIGGSKWKTRW